MSKFFTILIVLSSLCLSACSLLKQPVVKKIEMPGVPYIDGSVMLDDTLPDSTPVCFENWHVKGNELQLFDSVWRNCLPLGVLRKWAKPATKS